MIQSPVRRRSEMMPWVSFESDELILVDENDSEVGSLRKDAAHDGSGVLHRAFSVFIFNSAGALLLQQRAASKRLWGGYWSNTCCSHPRHGETMDDAVKRRLYEELGLSAPLQYLYKFQYQAQFDANGAEHELCSVYAGRSDATAAFNANEIEAVRYLSPVALVAEMEQFPQRFTPWFKLEWQRIREDYTSSFS